MKLDTHWLDWQPSTEKFKKSPEKEPSKPTKPGSGGFEGVDPTQIQTFFPLEAQLETYEDGFERWIEARCIYRDRAWWGLGALHNDYAIWCDKVGREVPGSLRTFKCLIREAGFRITDDGLCYGLILAEDLRLPQKAGRQ